MISGQLDTRIESAQLPVEEALAWALGLALGRTSLGELRIHGPWSDSSMRSRSREDKGVLGDIRIPI